MEVTVDELMDLFIDSGSQTIELWDLSRDTIVFFGTYESLLDSDLSILSDLMVCSIDTMYEDRGYITINIDTADMGDDDRDMVYHLLDTAYNNAE